MCYFGFLYVSWFYSFKHLLMFVLGPVNCSFCIIVYVVLSFFIDSLGMLLYK